jgi:uncharacterized membrane protein
MILTIFAIGLYIIIVALILLTVDHIERNK